MSGDPDWTASIADRLLGCLPELSPVWLSDRGLGRRTMPLRSATRLLGQDLDALAYDAHGGLDPDGFGAATGALRGGGLLLLLTPPLSRWPDQPDPQAARIAGWPHRYDGLPARFITRLAALIAEDPSVLRLSVDGALVPRHGTMGHPGAFEKDRRFEPAPAGEAKPATEDQARAVEMIVKTLRGRARRPLVLTAHRGRGKSAALGLAAARLLLEGTRRICLTAPSRAAAGAVLRHAEAYLRAAAPQDAAAPDLIRSLEFRAPADLVADPQPAEALLVDEAAGIPAPLLEAMLRRYGRIVFATTVHGYEGTGRGFEVRFRATLERLTPDARSLTLSEPIRWRPDDPLESLVFRALLLDASPAADAAVAGAKPRGVRLEWIDQAQLAVDEPLLREIFGLLVLAHYQTRPMDLRMLLDGPGLKIGVLLHESHVAATLLAVEEGGFTDPGLCSAIFKGERRPHGHLLPQTLSAHAGLQQAPIYRYLRVVRIATHPAVARRGLARRLLDGLYQEAVDGGYDIVGASFGATPELLAFWSACGHSPAQIGVSRNAASGEHAVVALRDASPRARRLLDQIRSRLEIRLRTLLPGPLKCLSPELVLSVLERLPAPAETASADDAETGYEAELRAFADGHRTLEASLPALAERVRLRLLPTLTTGLLSREDACLLVAAARQLRPPAELAELFGLGGRREVLTRLRRAAGTLL